MWTGKLKQYGISGDYQGMVIAHTIIDDLVDQLNRSGYSVVNDPCIDLISNTLRQYREQCLYWKARSLYYVTVEYTAGVDITLTISNDCVVKMYLLYKSDVITLDQIKF